ncbi:MAG: hypothetical protein RQ847_02865 [Wenzhouxiangellaceae bacterium]|nr:hypothetical protein [Wenzhouxiangellaceae bacterium]
MPVHKSPGAPTRAALAALSWCALLAGGAALPAGAAAQVEADTNRIFDPVELFRLHCWDPLRLDGGFLEPVPRTHWGSMTPQMRPEFNVPNDPSIKAWIKSDWKNGALVILEQQQHTVRMRGPVQSLVRQTCRVTYARPEIDRDAIYRDLVTLFNNHPGSDHPNELARIGAATPEGWDQRCWTVLADVNNRHWRMGRSSRDFRKPLCLVPSSDSFFGHSQYINVRLLMRTEGDPLTIIQTSRTIRQAAFETLYAEAAE